MMSIRRSFYVVEPNKKTHTHKKKYYLHFSEKKCREKQENLYTVLVWNMEWFGDSN